MGKKKVIAPTKLCEGASIRYYELDIPCKLVETLEEADQYSRNMGLTITFQDQYTSAYDRNNVLQVHSKSTRFIDTVQTHQKSIVSIAQKERNIAIADALYDEIMK